MSTITFNNIVSSDIGLMITKTPVPPCGQESAETIYIPGGKQITENKRIRENIVITVEATITEPGYLREIYKTFQGSGTLILSGEPDKCYRVVRCNQITPENIARYMNTLILDFECEPYAYAVSNDPVEITQTETSIDVGGNCECEPQYKIYGSGDIALQVQHGSAEAQADQLTINSVDGFAVVDRELLAVHKDGTTLTNTGVLPALTVGTNIISFDGNVAKIEITKNERWY